MTNVSVTIKDLWLTDAANPSVSVHGNSSSGGSVASLAGEFRSYAGGRMVVVSTKTDIRSFPLELRRLNDADVSTLQSWRGRVVLLRDGLGRRTFGSYLTVTQADLLQPGGVVHTVTLDFMRVTFSESV